MSNYQVELSERAFIELSVKGLDAEPVRVDVHEAGDVVPLDADDLKPAQKWEMIRAYLADKLGCAAGDLGMNQVQEFWDSVVLINRSIHEERKKKADSIVCSLPTIPESLTVGSNGANTESEYGETTSLTQPLGNLNTNLDYTDGEPAQQ